MHKIFLITGSVFGGLAVMIGAFGAHALQNLLESSGQDRNFRNRNQISVLSCIGFDPVGDIDDKY